MIFKYKGYNKSGNAVYGDISASNIQDAEQNLASRNIIFEKLKPQNSIIGNILNRKDMPLTLIGSFSKEFVSYIASGMTISSAISLMENQHENEKRYKSFLSTIKEMISEGKSLHMALSTQEIYRFPEFFLQSIKASSENGKIKDVLLTMSGFFNAQNKTKKQITNALAYPAFIFFIAISMSMFLLVFVVPKITSIFKETHQALPLLTQIVLSISDFFINYYVLISFMLLGIILGINFFYHKSPHFAAKVDNLLLRIPFVGLIISNNELARFSYILSLVLNSGVPYSNAIELASSTFNNLSLKNKFKEATIKVLEGKKLFQALMSSRGIKLQKNFMQSVALGEESSEMASVMSSIASYYIEDNEDKLKIFIAMLEPIMMLFVGLIVGIIVAAMLLPIFTMSLGSVS